MLKLIIKINSNYLNFYLTLKVASPNSLGQTTAIILNEIKNNPVATLVDHLLKAVVKIYKC